MFEIKSDWQVVKGRFGSGLPTHKHNLLIQVCQTRAIFWALQYGHSIKEIRRFIALVKALTLDFIENAKKISAMNKRIL